MLSSSAHPFAVILLGPTGVGKTAVALELAKHIPSEIVSADSRQVFRYMDIGTAKPTRAERAQVPHHFIDICLPDQIYSAGEYGEQARVVIDEILNRKKWPVVVGGSGLYLHALLEGFFAAPAANRDIQEQLKRRAREEGSAALHAELARVDPSAAARLHPHDAHRLVRALEIFYAGGKTVTAAWQQHGAPANFPYRLIGLNMSRPALYTRINLRVDKMLAEGLIEECRNLIKLGYAPELNALNTVGYQEVFQFLRDEISDERMATLIKQHSRNYAKRQMTWFRKMNGVEWIEAKPHDSAAGIAALILQYFKVQKIKEEAQ